MKPEDEKLLQQLKEKYPEQYKYIHSRCKNQLRLSSHQRSPITIGSFSPEEALKKLREQVDNFGYKIDYIVFDTITFVSKEKGKKRLEEIVFSQTLKEMSAFDFKKREEERIKQARIQKQNDKAYQEERKRKAFYNLKQHYEPEKILSEWITVEEHCATRVVKGTDPSLIENRVAFIEKTGRVRVLPYDHSLSELDDCDKWVTVYKGNSEYGENKTTRQKCDQVLKGMGYLLSEEL